METILAIHFPRQLVKNVRSEGQKGKLRKENEKKRKELVGGTLRDDSNVRYHYISEKKEEVRRTHVTYSFTENRKVSGKKLE